MLPLNNILIKKIAVFDRKNQRLAIVKYDTHANMTMKYNIMMSLISGGDIV